MNPRVADFPALIRWIADKHHGGAVHPIHERLRVSPALVQLWSKGGVKNPSLEYIERLCEVYNLDFGFVRGLLKRGRYATPIGGGGLNEVPLPLAKIGDVLLLIGSWLRGLRGRFRGTMMNRPMVGSWATV